MERLLKIASPLGLYAEEFETETARHLGNFPQAFSHLALLDAATRIILPEMMADYRPTVEDYMDAYDLIIVGTGAGGGTLARHLAPSGKRILLLERGDWLPREPANWLAHDVFVDNRYVSPDTWYDEKGKPFQPQIHYFVGGATKLYGAALYRLRAEDFGELQHHDGISPAWPISYDELEPYYTLAEQHYEVHGARGEDPTEPPASAPYPFPAVSHEPRIQQLSDDLEKAGYHPFHAPCGIRLLERDLPSTVCVRCQNCDGFPCVVHGKSDAEVFGVRPALEHDNVTLLTNAHVLRLETDAAGSSVTGVVVDHGGEDERYTADIVVLACGAANTAKLLLVSATDKHPNGLANGSDQVGRNYMFHNSQAVLAISREENPTIFQKTLGLNDFYLANAEFDYPLGNIQMVGKSQAEMYRGEKPGRVEAGPRVDARARRQARDRLLALDRGPATPGQSRHRGPRRQADPRVRADERGAEGEAAREARVAARQARPERGPPVQAVRLHEERDPGRGLSRTRPARAASAPIRRRRCSTSTAARTSSTTSTSSTRASFRASAQSIPHSPRWRTPSGSATTCSSGSGSETPAVAGQPTS